MTLAGLQPVGSGHLVLRRQGVSGRWSARGVVVLAVLAAVVVVLMVLGAAFGDFTIAPAEVVRVLLGGGAPMDRVVVTELRLPRVVAAALVGLALGAAGAVTQSVAGNPLASPEVLGITAGASAGAVAVIVLGGAGVAGLTLEPGPSAVTVAALLGGLVAAAVVHAASWRAGLDGLRLVLVGVAVSAVLVALTNWLLVAARITDAARATQWLSGSLAPARWDSVQLLTAVVVLAGCGLAATGRALRALRLGDDTARALGVRVQPARVGLLLSAVALTAAAVAVAGPIGFVALVAPQVALRLMRSAGPPVLGGALLGAALLLAADLLARVVLPAQLPVGVVTTVVGAPYLLLLLGRQIQGGTR